MGELRVGRKTEIGSQLEVPKVGADGMEALHLGINWKDKLPEENKVQNHLEVKKPVHVHQPMS